MSSVRVLRVLIVDDEEAGRQRLEDLLAGEADVEIAGQATNGREAVQAIKSLQPDLVFLDVQMPGLTGLEVVRHVGPEQMPAVIFVTAYDQYALGAFDLAALDYLLKPYDDERFERALARAREALANRELRALQDRLAALLRDAPPALVPTAPSPRYFERIPVELRGQVRIVPVERIDFISADGAYARLHVEDDTFFIREQMQSLEEHLDPSRFYRIHRGTIVQLDRIDALLFSPGGDYAVRLRDGRHLKVGRSRWEELSNRLGIQVPRQKGPGG